MACVSSLEAQAPRMERDIPYASDPHPEQHLDLHWPPGSPAATVLFVHGGSLNESGERRWSAPYRRVCEPFVATGVART